MRNVLVLVISMALLNIGGAYERTVLVELFTSTTCGYCPAAEQELDNIVAAHGGRVVELAYHVGWPAPGNDPFYHANPSESDARVSYYNVTGTPTGFVDGTEQSSLSSAVTSRLSVSSPLQLTVTLSEGYRVRGVIRRSSSISGDIRAFFAITESNINYRAPNGRNIFNGVMRDLIPNANGVPVNLTSGDSVVLEYDYTLAPSWNPANLKMIFFVQNRSTKEVYQTAFVDIPAPGYYFGLTSLTPTQSLVDPLSTEGVEFKVLLKNMGTLADSYKIRLIKNIPREWSSSFCTSSGCYNDSATVSLASLAQETLKVDIYPMGYEGRGKDILIVSSLGSPLLSDTITFEATTGGSVLIIDDDQGDNFERYYQAALDSTHLDHFTISRQDGPISSSTLIRFRAVVWFTGTPFTDVLSASDKIALQTYLTNGGKLFITGSEIGWALTDTSAFYRNFLHAHYVADSAWNLNVYGITGDPISDGMSFRIAGGDGANNQRYPDIIRPRDAYATPIFTYGTSIDSCAGLRIATGTYKVVYLGFGFEAIDNPASRALLMRRVMNYLGIESATAEYNPPAKPQKLSLDSVHPNPFNSEVIFTFESPENGTIMLEIFDVLGNRLWAKSENVTRGKKTERWNGKSDNGIPLPSGIYFLRLSFKNETETAKLLLLK